MDTVQALLNGVQALLNNLNIEYQELVGEITEKAHIVTCLTAIISTMVLVDLVVAFDTKLFI